MDDKEITLSSLTEEISSLQFPSRDPYTIIETWLLYHFGDKFEDLETNIKLFPTKKMTPLEIIAAFISHDMSNSTDDPDIFIFAYDSLKDKFYDKNAYFEIDILSAITKKCFDAERDPRFKDYLTRTIRTRDQTKLPLKIGFAIYCGEYETAKNLAINDFDYQIRHGKIKDLEELDNKLEMYVYSICDAKDRNSLDIARMFLDSIMVKSATFAMIAKMEQQQFKFHVANSYNLLNNY
jgi:hypothetical protein